MAGAPPKAGRLSRRVPFGAHQVAEYALGVALVASGLHLGGPTQLLAFASGGALVVMNLVTAGRMTLRPLLSRRAHHVVDLVLAAALIVTAATKFRELRAPGATLAGGLGLLLVWIERSTRYRAERVPAATRAVPARAVDPISVAGGEPAGATPPANRRLTTRSARTAGTVVGVTRRLLRERAREKAARRPATPPPTT